MLGERPRLVWYTPSPDDAATDAPPTLGELTPGWVTPAILLLGTAALAAAVWRGRRFGPLVVERLPVVVRADETAEGRARLYQRADARGHALDALRVGTVDRIASTLALGRLASVDDVVAASAATLREDPAAVRRLLRPSHHQLPVLSYQELIGAAEVRSVGVVTPDRMAVRA